MPSLNVRANTYLASSGSQSTAWTSTGNAVDGAYGSALGTVAGWASTKSLEVGIFDVGFGTQLSTGLASATTLASVTVAVRHTTSNVTRVTPITFQAFDGSTAIGTAVTGTPGTATVLHIDTLALPGVTLAHLKSSTFKIRVSATRFNGTTAGTFSLDHVDLAIVHSMPKAETLVDSFDSNIGAAWTSVYGGAVWEAGRVKAPVTGGVYAGINTAVGAYDLTESSIFAKVTPPPGDAAATSRETVFKLITGAYGLFFFVVSNEVDDGRNLLLRKEESAGRTNNPLGAYDPVAHAWMRFSHAGTDVKFDVSPDGVTWNNLWWTTTTTSLTALQVALECSMYSGGQSVPGVGYFDNVNSPPVTGTAQPLTGTVTAASTVVGNPVATHPLAGTAPAITTVTGDPTATHPITAAVVATTTTAGSVVAVHPLAGTVAGTSASAGSPAAVHPLVGTAAASATTSGTINLVGGAQTYSLAGLLPAVTTTSGTVRARYSLVGTVPAVTTTTGTFTSVSAGGKPKAYVSGSWQSKPGKVYVGGSWQPKPWKRWNGSAWVPIK